MNKMMVAAALASVCLAACGGGGGGGSDNSAPVVKALKVSMYGNPLTSGASPVVHAQIAADASAASAPAASSDAAATTVQTLQDALVSRGVPASVSAQVMNGTTLHQIIMGENNGLPPTQDQFKLDPSEWIVVNFQLDDMVTKADDPAQQVAMTQFAHDLSVFIQRSNVAGKMVFVVQAIPTCDVPNQNSAADGLNYAISLSKALYVVGTTPLNSVTDANGNVTTFLTGHMGADCRTPDAYIQNYHIQSIADDLANRYKLMLAGK